MAKKAKKSDLTGRKITLIQSEKAPTNVDGGTPVKVNLFVREPDNLKSKSFAVAARLCGCRRVCLAFIDPE